MIPSQFLRRLSMHFLAQQRTRALSQAVIDEISSIVGQENVNRSTTVRQKHSFDQGPYNPAAPDIVVFPGSTAEVSRVARTCYEHGVPMVPYGYGSGFEGGVQAVNGGVCICFQNMNKVLEVQGNDHTAIVQPGVSWREINAFVHQSGLWFPVDTGVDSSIGGMCATSASTTNAILYGTMRQNALNLEVVLPDGKVIDTAGKTKRCFKSTAGYNLTSLFIGSEGTLGIITKATLRLYCLPEVITTAVCTFPTVTSAIDTVLLLLRTNIPVARVDFIDDLSIRVCNQFTNKFTPAVPTLFIDLHATNSSTSEYIKDVKEIVHDSGGGDFKWATDKEERSRLMWSRNSLYFATRTMKSEARGILNDVSVPISNLPELITETKEDIEAVGIVGSTLAHVGDGTFHTTVLFDPSNKEELVKAREVSARISDRALRLDGTCSAEHGIGLGKKDLLLRQVGKDGLELMRSIKKSFDPKNIMNPGKIFS
ncbi:probable D-lactate dehydrogenase, mitochondrial [Ornithodoros turicata]|uniref:probable D-lactate dehydrogenase, mitochondrial n=1 Tax=Ornithodoros turicata TaxID=34597 RepID=UPI0031386263